MVYIIKEPIFAMCNGFERRLPDPESSVLTITLWSNVSWSWGVRTHCNSGAKIRRVTNYTKDQYMKLYFIYIHIFPISKNVFFIIIPNNLGFLGFYQSLSWNYFYSTLVKLYPNNYHPIYHFWKRTPLMIFFV